MRLICPNCGARHGAHYAHYEVPDEVPDQRIPPDGRGVQCSNCGNTVVQEHPDTPQAPPAPEPERDTGANPVEDALAGDGAAPAPRPDSGTRDSSVTDVLKEEAEREERLRAAEAGGLGSQPDPGLLRLVGIARARMARPRREPAEASPAADLALAPEQQRQRGLRPDIAEANPGPKSDTTALTAPTEPEGSGIAGRKRRSSGFGRGLMIMLAIAAIVLVVYRSAPQISANVPQIDPVMNAFVVTIDNARVRGKNWFDQQVGALAPAQ